MAIWLSSGFSHLRPGVFHISLQTHKTQYTQLRGWKKRTNNHRLWIAPSARREKFVTVLCSFLCICGLSRSCIRAKFPHSHQECWLILSHWPTWPLGPQVLASSLAVASSPNFCWLLWDLAFPCLLPVSLEISYTSPLCGFHAKTDKGIFWQALIHTQRNECHLSYHKYLSSY